MERNYVTVTLCTRRFFYSVQFQAKLTDTMRYGDTRCYCNVRSKADMSQLNLGAYRTETTTKKCKTEKKLISKNGYAQK